MIYERAAAGTPSPTPTNSPTPTPSPTPAGNFLNVAGNTFNGSIDLNLNGPSITSFVVASPENNWKKVSTGYAYRMYAMRSNNIWYCTGNNNGYLGIGDTIDRSSLVQFSTSTDWTDIFTDQQSGFGKKTNGSLWSWGAGPSCYNGQPDLISYSSPVQLIASGVNSFSTFLGGMVVKSDNNIYVFSSNTSSRFGTVVAENVTISSLVQTFTSGVWKQCSISSGHSAMIRNDGTLWTCGNNNTGQLGQNNIINNSSPVKVGTATTWKQCWAGYLSTYGLKTDNTLWAWGYNYQGQFGNNTAENYYSSPVQVIGNVDYEEIIVKWKFVAARDKSGKLWTWGYNSYGNLAQGNFNAYSSPTQVAYPSQYWSAIGCGYGSIFGVVGSNPAATGTPTPSAEPATPTATPAPTASRTPTPTASPIPTNTATPAPTASRTPTPTASPVPTSTPAPSGTVAPTSTPAPSGTVAPTATPAATGLPAPTPTIDTTGNVITMCYTDNVARVAGDTTAYTLSGFNSAYGTLAISSYSSGSGTPCLSYMMTRPAYSDETSITISYNNTGCYLTRVSTGQCLPSYTNQPVNNTSTKPKPTNTPTPSASAPAATPSPTPSVSAAAATPTPSASSAGPTPLTGGGACASGVAWPAYGSGNTYSVTVTTSKQWFTVDTTGRVLFASSQADSVEITQNPANNACNPTSTLKIPAGGLVFGYDIDQGGFQGLKFSIATFTGTLSLTLWVV